MWSFLSEFVQRPRAARTVVILDDDGAAAPRQYRIRSGRVLAVWAATLLAAGVAAALLVSLTPLRMVVPGYGAAEMRASIRTSALRVDALEDSLTVEQQHREQLQRLITGQVDASLVAPAAGPSEAAVSGELAEVAVDPPSANWADHAQPALPLAHVPAGSGAAASGPAERSPRLPSLQFPVLPPVEGYVTRGFDARAGHYAIDLAVAEGTPVRSVGDGYVILADWTQGGGYAIAVQHVGGYVSIYKHNQQLLKRVGDRVRAREALAVSGNTGEVTTGPHVHVELWSNGLAQDPAQYFTW